MYLTFVTFFSWFLTIDVASELPVNIYNGTWYITFTWCNMLSDKDACSAETALLHVAQMLLLLLLLLLFLFSVLFLFLIRMKN